MTRQSDYERLHRSPETRAAAIKLLETLAERYPHLRLGQILVNAVVDDFYSIDDEEFLRRLDQLRITFSQFEAAKVKI